MAVTSYLGKNGDTLWRTSVSIRSEKDPSIRLQKAKFGFQTEQDARKEESKLIRVCEREILTRETQGASWATILEAWEMHLRTTDLASSTKQDYVAAAYNHTSSWMNRPAASINSFDVREVLNQLKANGGTYDFLKRIKNMLGQIFVFGMERRLIKGIDRSPTFGIQLGKPEEK